MSVKLANNVRTVGASLYNGILAVTIGPDTWTIEIPTKQNYSFQINEYNNANIFCYLYNDDTELVIRRDGTGSLIKRKTMSLIKNFAVNIPVELKDVDLYHGGLANFKGTGISDFINLCVIKSKGTAIISFDSHGDSIIFNIKDCFSYLTDLTLQLGPSYPLLFYDSDGKFTKHMEADNSESKVLYEFSGSVLQHPSILALE